MCLENSEWSMLLFKYCFPFFPACYNFLYIYMFYLTCQMFVVLWVFSTSPCRRVTITRSCRWQLVDRAKHKQKKQAWGAKNDKRRPRGGCPVNVYIILRPQLRRPLHHRLPNHLHHHHHYHIALFVCVVFFPVVHTRRPEYVRGFSESLIFHHFIFSATQYTELP